MVNISKRSVVCLYDPASSMAVHAHPWIQMPTGMHFHYRLCAIADNLQHSVLCMRAEGRCQAVM